MLLQTKSSLKECEMKDLVSEITELGVEVVSVNHGEDTDTVGLLGVDIQEETLEKLAGIDKVQSLSNIEEGYKRASRTMKNEDSVISIGDVKIGGGHYALIAGPCSIESEEQLEQIAIGVKEAGGTVLRGGAYKPRTSPYSFQGLEEEGAAIMARVGERQNIPTVSEVMSVEHIEPLANVDALQVGARNMQNFSLLKELGKLDKPILLKRGFSNTIEELLMAAEYIMAGGNEKVILCERGIRTFETATRSTLDVSAVPVLREKTHLPIVVDPSHAAGKREYVEALSLAAVAAGADGLIVECHYDPVNAWSDARQCITLETLADIQRKSLAIRSAIMD